MKKQIQNFKKNTRYEILSPDLVWENFDGIIKNTGERDGVRLYLDNGKSIDATLDHRFYENFSEKVAKDFNIGDRIDGINEEFHIIKNIENIKIKDVYDIFNSESHKILCNNSISSHQCDEFAFVHPNKAEAFWTSIQPILSTGGSCIITSTPKSDEDQFAQIWKGAINNTDEFGNPRDNDLGINDFYAVKVPWWEHPERDELWAKPFRESLGPARFAQEFECCDGRTLINTIDNIGTKRNITIGELYQLLKM